MMRLALAILLGLSFSAQALAQPASERLAWKFSEGDEFFLSESTRITQTISIGKGTPDATSNSRQQMIFRAKVGGVGVGKNPETAISLGVRRFFVDGKVPTKSDIAKSLLAAQFDISLLQDGQVRSFSGYDDWVKKWAGSDPQRAALLANILPRAVVRDAIAAPFRVLPGKTVQPKKTWSQASTINLGPFGKLNLTRTYKHAGKKKVDGKEMIQIEISGASKYAPPIQLFESLPYRYVKGELQLKKLSGTGYYDPAIGRLVKMDVEIRLEGKLTLSVEKAEQEFEVKQTRKTQLVISDEQPQRTP